MAVRKSAGSIPFFYDEYNLEEVSEVFPNHLDFLELKHEPFKNAM